MDHARSRTWVTRHAMQLERRVWHTQTRLLRRATKNPLREHTKPSPAAQRAMESAAQAQQRANNPASVASPVQHPSSNFTPEPLPEGGANPSSTDDTGAPGSGNDGSDNKQDQAAAEPTYDFAYVYEAWKAREGRGRRRRGPPRDHTPRAWSGVNGPSGRDRAHPCW